MGLPRPGIYPADWKCKTVNNPQWMRLTKSIDKHGLFSNEVCSCGVKQRKLLPHLKATCHENSSAKHRLVHHTIMNGLNGESIWMLIVRFVRNCKDLWPQADVFVATNRIMFNAKPYERWPSLPNLISYMHVKSKRLWPSLPYSINGNTDTLRIPLRPPHSYVRL